MPEGQVRAHLREEGVHLAQVPDLLGLVADVVAVEPKGIGGLVRDCPAHAAPVGGPSVPGAAELGDHQRLAVPQLPAYLLAERAGVARVPVGVDGRDVERPPVDRLPRGGGIAHRAAEPAPDRLDGRGEEAVQPGGHRAECPECLLVAGLQAVDAVVDRAAWQEPGAPQAQLAPGDKDDAGTGPAEPFGPLGAVREQRRHLPGGELAPDRREPRLQARRRGEFRGGADPLRPVAGDPHRGAAQLAGDDPHLAADDSRVEPHPRALAARAEPGVVGDALTAHYRAFPWQLT